MPIEINKNYVPKPQETSDELEVLTDIVIGVDKILSEADKRANYVRSTQGLPPEFREAEIVKHHFLKTDSQTDPETKPE